MKTKRLNTGCMFLLALLASGNLCQADSGFLPGRITSRTASRTILATCVARDGPESEPCRAFQFYYSPTGQESDAKRISERTYTLDSLEDLRSRPIWFNAFDAFFEENQRPEGSYVGSMVRFLNDYEDHWGESRFARISYATGRGVAYGTLVPITAAMDLGGSAIGLPSSLISVVVSTVKNGKIRKLVRAIADGQEIKMDIDRVYRLRDQL